MSVRVTEGIDRLWGRFWAGGIANPLTAVEQVAYLILLKRLDMIETDRGPAAHSPGLFEGAQSLRWRVLRDAEENARFEVLRRDLVPFLAMRIESPAFREAMQDASFSALTPKLVTACIEAIDALDFDANDFDFQGEVFEELLRQLQLSGRDSQNMTPRNLTRAIVGLVAPRRGDLVFDPAAGTAGFLVEARRYATRPGRNPPGDDNFAGCDLNPGMVRLGVINMLLHGIERPRLRYANTLSDAFAEVRADVVVTNPPFSGRYDAGDLQKRLNLKTSRAELLFFELSRRMLRPGGRAAIVIPEGVLFGRSSGHVEARRRWLQEGLVHAVISLPVGVFAPYANIRTAIVYATAAFDARTESVWFCRLDEGDASRPPASPAVDELEFLGEAVGARLREEVPRLPEAQRLASRMWSTPIEEIEAREFNLAPATYERVGPSPAEADPLQLLERVGELQEELREQIDGAKRILEQSP